MDMQLLRTFLEVIDTGAFASAAERLHVTQSAVSLRVQRLEDQLGRPLFLRHKTGVEPTPAGREFRRHAWSILKSWDQARRQVGAMEAEPASLTIGAEAALWPRLGFRWLDGLKTALPEATLRAELGGGETILRRMAEGEMHVGLSFTPIARTGLRCEPLLEDQLVLVAPTEDCQIEDISKYYILADWGPDFLRFHETALPELPIPNFQLSLGTLVGSYIRSRPFAAYLPARYVKPFLDAGQLHLVEDAPNFTLESWVIWRSDLETELADVAESTLKAVVARLDEEVNDLLDDL
ncbi:MULTISPECIES: LysR family transcriptional regulator [Gemmobacter]|jgi:DNA-binding transcriptional LysR family regulator|uniref:DNA-binding transcriptional LysR family regulator n=2 Tax=Gemmobacter TaxID=204456 RepID=A0A2T6AQA8_9RHOB|nr:MULTISPECIES: LysR family transcriptional regulator [Gemmobacter]OJY32702.1 MAG: hypothetical protein BGP11_01650 [Rhodobacterales bacterium 65-51]PTX46011.1 DNA-binding transcriptional LysR family regulator [Gemmobacter caeni]TWI94313.1 DNA-binding transcriptional LysR family regulator [Gemmobacter caeni]GHC09523.1 LysR family transcriptional regulator [Gemmobacter nanjingensis]